MSGNYPRNQTITRIRRFGSSHQPSQQRLGLHQRKHGRLLCWNTKAQKHFQGLEILHVLHDSNIAADILAKLGSDRAKVPPGVFIEELSAPSIKQSGEITPEISDKDTQILVITTSWTLVFIDYIKENKLPTEKEEATRVVRRSKNYVLVGGTSSTEEPHRQEYS